MKYNENYLFTDFFGNISTGQIHYIMDFCGMMAQMMSNHSRVCL